MKKWCLIFFLLTANTVLFSHPSSAYHSFNYYLASSTDNMCTHCHPGGPHAHIPECAECHTATAPPYSVDVAPVKQTHSSAVIGSNKYGTWARECLDCHDMLKLIFCSSYFLPFFCFRDFFKNNACLIFFNLVHTFLSYGCS